MAIKKPDWETKTQDDLNKEANGVFEKPVLSEESLAVQEIYSILRSTVDESNAIIKSSSIKNNELTKIDFNISELKGRTSLNITVTLKDTVKGKEQTKSIALDLK
tara:strand:+ start:555 stop:869 length:315 start_codon:yes stop_codon:yes gene_type:complete